MKKKEFRIEHAGKNITASFSDLADQADGSVMVSCGGTVIFAAATMSVDGSDNRGWFNLSVEYQEKYYAAGEILGGPFSRREGRPSTKAVLGSRIIDRTLRPLFDQRIKNAVQIVVQVIALGEMDPVVLGVNAASLALATSSIPWAGPVSCVRLSQTHDQSELHVHDYHNSEDGDDTPYQVDLLVCGQKGTVNMIEAHAFEMDEEKMGTALSSSVELIDQLEKWQESIIKEVGKEKEVFEFPELPEELTNYFNVSYREQLHEVLFNKKDGKKNITVWEKKWMEDVKEKYPADLSLGKNVYDRNNEIQSLAKDFFHHMTDVIYHDRALRDGVRADERAMDEVRDLYAQAGDISERLHGSGIFYRGGTHVMSVLALDGPDQRLEHDEMEEKRSERFIHHYNFPPFSAGETGRIGGFNRRAIGHGELAEKALWGVLPSVVDFPHTIRVVSESMASNGSTSQASICGTSLALMDGGVPIKRHVAGIAMGLMTRDGASDEVKKDTSISDYVVLTDIQGPEDHHGDMDCKVAGTREGITAVQLDIKVGGVSVEILQEALIAARQARIQIIETMESALATPRPELSPYAPQILSIQIPVEKIGAVIGSGGKNIQKLQEETATDISIEDDGKVFITGKGDGPQQARERVALITKEWEIGEIVPEGIIEKILDIGIIVKISPVHDGLVHISEMTEGHVKHPSDLVKEGMKVPVKVVSVDKERHRIGLSIKQADDKFFNKKDEK